MPTATTTPAAIRDRIATVIVAMSPTSLAVNTFREYRNEGAGDFAEWCESHPASALRRFEIVETGDDGPPETSSALEEERTVTFTVTIAYPHDARYGAHQAVDRYRVMREDQFKIEKAIGMHGKANFTPSFPDATWLLDGSGADRVEGDACDFLVITQRMIYVLDVS